MPSTPDHSRELTANPPPRVTTPGSAEQLVTYNTDVTDRMIEKRNLADLLKRFSQSGSPASHDRLRAAL
jgi:hypothetical protein